MSEPQRVDTNVWLADPEDCRTGNTGSDEIRNPPGPSQGAP